MTAQVTTDDSSIDSAASQLSAGLGNALTEPIGCPFPGACSCLSAAQILVSEEADFERGTWTFKISRGVRVGAGRYPIIKLPNVELTGAEGVRVE